MANIYVRSTDGNNADNGSTWALAKAGVGYVAGASSIDQDGDIIWLSQAHSESSAAAVVMEWGNPVTIGTTVLCGNDGAQPPTALATTAIIATTGASDITLNSRTNSRVYFYGVTFKAGDGANTANIFFAPTNIGGSSMVVEQCSFVLNGTSLSSRIQPATSGSGSLITLKNCTFKFNNAAQAIGPNSSSNPGLRMNITGGSLLAGGTSPTALFKLISFSEILVENFDFSNADAGMNLIGSAASACRIIFRNCKLPASWSGALNSSVFNLGGRAEMHNCDSADTNYRLWVEDNAGTIKSETTIVRTGGSSDGTTTLSWKMSTETKAKFPAWPLLSPERAVWNETTGSSKTLTVEIVHDSQGAGSGSKFQDDEIWLEVMYLGTSGFPLGTWVSDAKANILATAANQADSATAWTTTGLATPVKQALSVTFTPQEKGHFIYRIAMAKASKTCYVDAMATVT